jgi:hypothetical protein
MLQQVQVLEGRRHDGADCAIVACRFPCICFPLRGLWPVHGVLVPAGRPVAGDTIMAGSAAPSSMGDW